MSDLTWTTDTVTLSAMPKPAAQFQAIIPDIQSAFRFFGSGGGRVEFEFPKSEEPNVLDLLLMREAVLTVTVTIGDSEAPTE